MGRQSTQVSALNCIDISNSDINQSVRLLKQACLDSGFFYVVNHGISQEFMDEVFAQSKKFFSLPLEEKMKIIRNEKHRGYTPVLDELLDPENQLHGDYKEGYYIGVEKGEDDPESKKPFYGQNRWPAPDVLPGWRETMEKFHGETLYVLLMPKIFGEPIAILRLLRYEGIVRDILVKKYCNTNVESHKFRTSTTWSLCLVQLQRKKLTWLYSSMFNEGQISDPSKGIYGAGAHTDFGVITLLATDDVSGLQICKNRDAKPQIWEDVAPLKGLVHMSL
ncbi:hypothetical protein V8G54_011365 [Vigna mungo]|uniref:Uncharacterized protein n=1 Tax=Vigna mungo TaxID=3915 RepID=A0AAQ3NP06_VIGMU